MVEPSEVNEPCRAQFNCSVSPETRRILRTISAATERAQGRIIDEAIAHYASNPPPERAAQIAKALGR